MIKSIRIKMVTVIENNPAYRAIDLRKKEEVLSLRHRDIVQYTVKPTYFNMPVINEQCPQGLLTGVRPNRTFLGYIDSVEVYSEGSKGIRGTVKIGKKVADGILKQVKTLKLTDIIDITVLNERRFVER